VLLRWITPGSAGIVSAAQKSVAFVYGDPGMWRFSELTRTLESQGQDVVLLNARAVSGDSSGSLLKTVGPAGNILRTLDWRSARDWLFVYNLGVIFYSQPYLMSGMISSVRSLRNTRKVYVPYTFGESMNSAQFTFGASAISRCDIAVISNPQLAGPYLAAFGVREAQWGYPELSLIDQGSKSSLGKVLNILWAPHWTTSLEKNEDGVSQLERWANSLLQLKVELLKKGLTVYIRCRAHPRLLEKRGQNLADAGQLLRNLESSGGMMIEPKVRGVHHDFNWSHVLVHNGGSFTIEYLASLKPALYLTEKSVVIPTLNSLGNLALDHHYKCENLGQLEQQLREISAGKDPMRGIRNVFWSQILSKSLGFEDQASSYILNP